MRTNDLTRCWILTETCTTRVSARFLIRITLSCAVAATFMQGRTQAGYVITGIGTLSGAGGSYAFDINGSGQVASSSGSHATIYSGGTLSDLGTLGGGATDTSYAFGINSSAQATGSSTTAGSGSATHAYIYSSGTMQGLGTLGGTNSTGEAINDSGQVAGYSNTVGGDIHAFLYSGGVMSDLGTLGGTHSEALGINSSGEVTGYAYGSTYSHAFVYSGGTMTDIDTNPDDSSQGNAINDSGHVAGWFRPNVGPAAHAFIYSDGTMTDLGTLVANSNSYAQGINNLDQVVGYNSASTGQHAFLYSGGSMTDLNDLISAGSGWTLTDAEAINDIGQITGYGIHNGITEGFILTPEGVAPTSEPASIALFGIGMITLAGSSWRRRRRLAASAV